MATRLRVLAGPCPENLVPITDIVNTPTFHKVSSNIFDGEIGVHIKDFTDENGVLHHSKYFERDDRQGITWSIQVAGRFLQSHSADDILFGNIFERPLSLPWGTSAVLKFMQFIDPTLEHDLFSQTKPWALSPLVSTMPHFAYKRIGCDKSSNEKDLSLNMDSRNFLKTDFTGQLHLAATRDTDSTRASTLETEITQLDSPVRRRKYFSNPENRRAIQFGPDDTIFIDFCYGFLEFAPTIALRLPGGLSFDIARYWDRQPVMFVCCERAKEGESPWGQVFWCVVIEMV